MAYCKITGCRYPNTHLTLYHKCGRCHKYGHGQYECHQLADKNVLITMYVNNQTLLSEYDHCTIDSCKFPWSHKTIAHHCEICGKNGHDSTIECEFIINKTCPICKIKSDIDLTKNMYADHDCSICLENNEKKVVFSGCKHAQVCEVCVKQLLV